MDEPESFRVYAKSVLRAILEVDITEAENILKEKGIPALRINIIRSLKVGVIEGVSRRWAKERGMFPVGTDDMRTLMEVFNEVMDELAAEATE